MAETVTSVFGGHMTETVERRRDTRYGTGMVADQPAREADQYETHCHGASTGRPWPFWPGNPGNVGSLLWAAKFTERTVDDTDWLIFGYRPRGTRSALRFRGRSPQCRASR